ncbi:MAG: helix-turn-helix transcriptional regulator [Bacteroidales bacterium]
MRTILNFIIKSDFDGFKLYIKKQIGSVKLELIKHKHIEDINPDRLDRYATALLIEELGDIFLSLLSTEEKECLRYLAYHSPKNKEPNNYSKLTRSAYKKRLSAFYKRSNVVYKDISISRLGKMMKRIREDAGMSAKRTADILEVDRSTISLFERGRRAPSLN